MKRVGIGLIGSGFMGKCHSLAYRAVTAVFEMPLAPVLEILADVTPEAASRAAQRLGFTRATGNWRDLLADPAVDVIDICTPPETHAEMALAACAAGKHVYCEKPTAPRAEMARQMMEAAQRAGIKTQIGFNYLKNPMIGLAREMIAAGELGEIVSFRGIHAEDYMAGAHTPWHWRLDPAGGGGVVADLGSHIVAMARHLLGPITKVCAELETVVTERPATSGSREMRRVDNDDIARALLRFARGCGGSLEANWLSQGRKMQIEFEIVGEKGALHFNQERLNELRVYDAAAPAGRRGFKTIHASVEHPPYGEFCPAPGHQLGFNDLKTIEVRDFLLAIAGGPVVGPDMREGYEVQKVVDAMIASSRSRSWWEV
jgi:predicted dehydrogenase